MCVCVRVRPRERERGKHLHLQFLFGRSSAPGKQCLVLSLVFYVPSELRAQAGLCGREVAGLTPERPMQLFTTAGRIRVCVRKGACVCVCVTQSAGTCVSGVSMCMHVTGGSECGRRGHGGDTIAIRSVACLCLHVCAWELCTLARKCHLKCISRVVSERFVGLAAVSFSAVVLEPGVGNEETRAASPSPWSASRSRRPSCHISSAPSTPLPDRRSP